MKNLLSKGSITKIMFLMLLLLNAFAAMTILVNAPAAKTSNVLISGSGSVELTWKSGKSATYNSTDYEEYYANLGGLDTIAIIPTNGWHIYAFLADGNPQGIPDEDGFTSTLEVRVKRDVSVTFLENGGVDDVDLGSNMPAYPTPEVGLNFFFVTEEGNATAYTIGLQQPDQFGESWDIQTTAIFQENVTIYLVLNRNDLPPPPFDPTTLTLWKTQLVPGDVDLNGIVTASDVAAIANVNPGDPVNPLFDLNGDGIVNAEDVGIASHNLGEESVWTQLDPSWAEVVNGLVYVYGVTSGLSIFGCSR